MPQPIAMPLPIFFPDMAYAPMALSVLPQQIGATSLYVQMQPALGAVLFQVPAVLRYEREQRRNVMANEKQGYSAAGSDQAAPPPAGGIPPSASPPGGVGNGNNDHIDKMGVVITKIPFHSLGLEEDRSLERLLIEELVNPDFRVDVRRQTSLIREPYRSVLDPFNRRQYPLNILGTFARVPPDYLESHVNIGNLMRLIVANTQNQELRVALNSLDLGSYRMALRRAIHAVGDLSYDYEWSDVVTFSNIDSLLEGMAAYRSRNIHAVRSIKGQLINIYKGSEPVVLLDIGSGVGGTSVELFNVLEELRRDGSIPQNYRQRTRLVLLDASDVQLTAAYREISRRFDFQNISLIQSNFRNLAKALERYNGKVNIAVSGAAICHVTQKGEFFKALHSVMSPGGTVSIWDPAVSQYQAQRMRVGEHDRVRIHFKTDLGEEIVIDKGELLDPSIISRLSDVNYETTVEVPLEEIEVFANLQRLHLFQMGYSAGHIGGEMAMSLSDHLHDDVLRDSMTPRGFSVVEWYRTHISEDPAVPRLRRALWSPYELIEAVEEKSSYERYISEAGFSLTESKRFSELFANGSASADMVTAYYLMKK